MEELCDTFMQVDDDGKPRYDELVFPADGRGYFVIDTVPSLRSINEAKTETGVRLEIIILITALLRQFMIEARSWAEKSRLSQLRTLTKEGLNVTFTKSPWVNPNLISKPKTLVASRQPALRMIQVWTLAAYQQPAVNIHL